LPLEEMSAKSIVSGTKHIPRKTACAGCRNVEDHDPLKTVYLRIEIQLKSKNIAMFRQNIITDM
jgi:hypothetical protein